MPITENLEKKLSAIEKNEKKIRAFIDVFPEEARAKAEELEGKAKRGEKFGRLAGLTVAVKSNICIKGKRATCSSKMLENYVAPYDATVIEKITREGAIIIGTTNMDEFACGSDTTKSAFYPTRNPRDTKRVPGGSSGGSAAAVAAGFSDLALGSDTGGSIRCPASFCGVVGFKSTYGTVSRYGLIDMGMSLDQIGPLANDVESAALLLSVITGKDGRDAVTTDSKIEMPSGEVKGLKVGVPTEFFEGVDERVEKPVREAMGKLEAAGAELVDVSIPHVRYAVPIYYLLVFAEFSSAMQKYDGLRYGAPADVSGKLAEAISGVRDSSFGREVKRRILLGAYITMKEFRDAWYTKTLRARRVLKEELERALKKADVLAGPAMPVLPWKIGEKMENPVEMYLADILTVSANLAGLPAGVVPCGNVGKLPVGFQVHGGYFEEKKVLDAMLSVERELK